MAQSIRSRFSETGPLPAWPTGAAQSGYVIFTPGRAGSTLLGDALARTGVCGAPHEFFNPGAAAHFDPNSQATSFGDYLQIIIRDWSRAGRFGFKIDWFRLNDVCELIDFEQAFPPSHFQYIYLTRRDVVAQAYSMAHAIKSGVWHRSADEEDVSVADSRVNGVDLWKHIGLVFEAESKFEAFFAANNISPLRIDYGVICVNLQDAAAVVMNHVGCSPTEIVQGLAHIKRGGYNPLDYDVARASLIIQFKIAYRGLLEELATQRGKIGVEDVGAFLRENLPGHKRSDRASGQ